MSRVTIVVAMHDGLSTALILAASRFIDVTKVIDLPLLADIRLEEYRKSFLKILEEHQEVLVLTDILVGACSVALLPLLQNKQFALVTGANLTMLIDSIEYCDELNATELMKYVKQSSINDIKNVDDFYKEFNNGK
ncbi:MAG: hypothetical protein RR734_04730 [Bacilli bacterium]